MSNGIRYSLLKIVPNWLANRPTANVAFRVLWVIAVVCDLLIELMFQAVYAAFPGVGTPTANSLLGIGRGLTQGPNESDALFTSELLGYMNAWFNAGATLCLAQRLQAFLGGTYTIRIVDRSGHWLTLNPDGTNEIVNASWDWDSVSNPERSGWWSDIWIIVYSSEFPWYVYTGFDDPNWIANWGSTQVGLGHSVDRATVQGFYATLSMWKGAHTYIEAIIWNTDPSLFLPGTTPPDGTWGNWAWHDDAVTQRPARTTRTDGGTVCYWIPVSGG